MKKPPSILLGNEIKADVRETANILVVTNIPTPYRIPLFNELRIQFEKNGLSFFVAFDAPGYERRKWETDPEAFDFNYCFLSPKVLKSGANERPVFRYRGLGSLISDLEPDLVFVIGYSPGTLKICARHLFGGPPYVIWSGAVDTERTRVSWLRTMLRRFLVKFAVGFVAYGSDAKDYLQLLGAPSEKVRIAINTVETDYFRDQAIRQGKKCPSGTEQRRFLYIGNLTVGKRVDNLLVVLAELSKTRDDFILDIVGEGPQREPLRRLASELGIERRVVFHGFKPREEVPGFLAASYCFLFPSEYDVWGLVLVEAMSAGVPCLSAVQSGATRDLIKPGETGFAVDFNRTVQLADQLAWMLDNPQEVGRMGKIASEFIQEKASIAVSARGFVEVAEFARERSVDQQ